MEEKWRHGLLASAKTANESITAVTNMIGGKVPQGPDWGPRNKPVVISTESTFNPELAEALSEAEGSRGLLKVHKFSRDFPHAIFDIRHSNVFSMLAQAISRDSRLSLLLPNPSSFSW